MSADDGKSTEPSNELPVDRPLEELYSERLSFEHELLAQRITGLLTLDGFLVGAMALLTSSSDSVGDLLPVAIVGISLLGTFSNASVLFSNWWATRALQEVGNVISEWWHTELSDQERAARTVRMRLYGRDPRAFHGYQKFTPSEWLHPWLLLPSIFTLSFLLLPLSAGRLSEGLSAGYFEYATFLVPICFGLLMFFDHKRHLENAWWEQTYGATGTHRTSSETPTRKEVKDIHAKKRTLMRKWAKECRDRKYFPRRRIKGPGRWGIIPTVVPPEYMDWKAKLDQDNQL